MHKLFHCHESQFELSATTYFPINQQHEKRPRKSVCRATGRRTVHCQLSSIHSSLQVFLNPFQTWLALVEFMAGRFSWVVFFFRNLLQWAYPLECRPFLELFLVLQYAFIALQHPHNLVNRRIIMFLLLHMQCDILIQSLQTKVAISKMERRFVYEWCS